MPEPIASMEMKRQDWIIFFKIAFSILAIGLTLSGLACFVAFHWQRLGLGFRLGVVELPLLLAAGLGYWLGLDHWAGKLGAFAAAALVGCVLAVFGQAFPSGVLYKLFFVWSLCCLPFAVVARFPPIWLMALACFETGMAFYLEPNGRADFFGLVFSETSRWAWLSLVNASALVFWELLAHDYAWLRARYGPRLIALAGEIFLQGLVLMDLFHRNQNSTDAYFSMFLCLAVQAALFVIYRTRRDLFMLVLALLFATITVNEALLKAVGAEMLWPMSLVSLAAAVFGAGSLMKIHEQWQKEAA